MRVLSVTKKLVILECKVIKQLICEDCTDEQIEEDPFEFATDVMEIDQLDWELRDITECPEGL